MLLKVDTRTFNGETSQHSPLLPILRKRDKEAPFYLSAATISDGLRGD